MTDRFEEGMAGLGRRRALDPEFRVELEHALVEAMGGERNEVSRAGRWTFDRPRAMPSAVRARVEAAIIKRAHPPRLVTQSIAAAVAVLLVASSVMVAVGRRSGDDGAALQRPVVSPSPTPTLAAGTAMPPVRPGSLRGFHSAADFLRYVRREALQANTPYGLQTRSVYHGSFGRPQPAPPVVGPGGSPPVPMPAMGSSSGYSVTNIQEDGVDEPDIVKTDGRTLVSISWDSVRLLDVTGGTARLVGSYSLSSGGIGAFLVGDRVIAFSGENPAPPAARAAVHEENREWTKVTVLDISRPAAPKLVSSFEVEGSYVNARLARGVVRLVVESGALGPEAAPAPSGSSSSLAAAEATNRRRILNSSVGDWVPHYVAYRPGHRTVTGHVHDWSAVSRPPDRAGVSMLTVLTIDPADPRPDNALSVMGSGELLYATADSLYVTSNRYEDAITLDRGRRPSSPVTRIHRFDISDPKVARYTASGEVPGYLLNQFSLSEHEGYLRVASTLLPVWMEANATTSRSYVTVLKEKAGTLARVASLGNLGVGERIYSVRFIGTKGYVVTFRQIDPLHVIDLRTPSRPRLRGELKVPGYSGYLHPLSESLLLGVGRDADADGAPHGLQLSLFDVSDVAHPRRLDAYTEGTDGFSSVENDHHSFLYWGPRHLVVVPAVIYEKPPPQPSPSPSSDPSPQPVPYMASAFVGALAITIDGSSFGDPVRLTHTGRPASNGSSAAIERSLVIGNRLLTVSYAGVLVSDLSTFADRSWVPFNPS